VVDSKAVRLVFFNGPVHVDKEAPAALFSLFFSSLTTIRIGLLEIKNILLFYFYIKFDIYFFY
jgi:hypothetical protein